MRWVQRLNEEASLRRPACSCVTLSRCWGRARTQHEVELLNWWVVLGVGGGPAAQTSVAILAANSLTQNLATREENGCFPLSALLFWVLFFAFFYF